MNEFVNYEQKENIKNAKELLNQKQKELLKLNQEFNEVKISFCNVGNEETFCLMCEATEEIMKAAFKLAKVAEILDHIPTTF